MAKIVTIFTPKGGAGKTTLALHLGYWLATTGQKKVSFVDADERAMLQDTLNRAPENFPGITATYYENMMGDDADKAERIIDIIEEVSHDRDVVIVDCGGYMATATLYAMAQSDLVLIPLTPDLRDLQMAFDTYDRLLDMVQQLGVEDSVMIRAVINNANTQTNAFSLTRAGLAERGLSALDSVIPAYTAYRDASFVSSTVFRDRPSAQATVYMSRFARECDTLLFGGKKK